MSTSPATTRFRVYLAAALLVGLLIGWIDTRPSWDDTGITVGLIFLSSAVFGALMPSRAWVWGCAVGLGIPLMNLFLRGNPAALISFLISFAGSYMGVLARKFAEPSV